jgi:hypothetical protein
MLIPGSTRASLAGERVPENPRRPGGLPHYANRNPSVLSRDGEAHGRNL